MALSKNKELPKARNIFLNNMEIGGREASQRKFQGHEKQSSERTFSASNLSIIEHIMIGSSAIVGKKSWGNKDVERLLGTVKNRDGLRKKLLTPIAFLDKEKTVAEIRKERSQKRRLIGEFPIFDSNQQIQLAHDQNIKVYLELGEINGNGELSGEWKVGLVDDKNNEIDSSDIRLSPEQIRYFILEKDQLGKGQILRLRL